MRSLDPPRSGAADRKSADRPRRPLIGPRPARAPRQSSAEAGARREVPAAARSPAAARAAGGLPERLQTVMEAMSGFSLADVVVHRNSAEPARLGAAAFSQGNQIHVAPGQERHLPHEAWHVVQQMQGRVRPTLQLKGGAAVNDDGHLEREAEVMGGRADKAPIAALARPAAERSLVRSWTGGAVVQRALSGSDRDALEAWCGDQKVELPAEQLNDIRASTDTLEAAKNQVRLEVEAARESGKRAKLLGVNLAKAKERKEKASAAKDDSQVQTFDQQIQMIEDVLADLAQGGLGRSLPAAVASLAELLMTSYPPKDYSYVMMGNSPAPLLAWMQLNKMGSAAFHLPLGGLTAPEGVQAMKGFDEKYGKGAVQEKVSSYLDAKLKEAASRGKPLVLVDYASTGGSLAVTADCIETWLESRKLPLKIFIFGYSEQNLDALPLLTSGRHEGLLATATGRMEKAFTKMNADKIFKKVMLLRGPASLDVKDLLSAQNPAAAVVEHPDHWARVLRLMRKAFE